MFPCRVRSEASGSQSGAVSVVVGGDGEVRGPRGRRWLPAVVLQSPRVANVFVQCASEGSP